MILIGVIIGLILLLYILTRQKNNNKIVISFGIPYKPSPAKQVIITFGQPTKGASNG